MDAARRLENLGKEYELCQDYAKHLENNIWTSAGVIGLGSIGSFLLSSNDRPKLFPLAILGLLTISIVWVWWLIANRWWDIQHVTFIRMRHIETRLHLYRNRYIHYLDRPISQRDIGALEGLSDTEQRELWHAFPAFHKGRVRGYMKWIPIAITILWVLYYSLALYHEGKDLLMQVIGNVSITWIGLLIVLGSVFVGGVGIGLFVGILLYGRLKPEARQNQQIELKGK